MTRIYFKTKQADDKFSDKMKELGADYVEDEDDFLRAVFKMPKKIGSARVAIAIDSDDGAFSIGKIKESCDNFEEGCIGVFEEEMKWIFKMYKKLKDAKVIKLKSNEARPKW